MKVKVMKMFRKLRGVRLSYIEQGVIYFTCMNYKNLPETTKEKIRNLCKEVCALCEEAEIYEKALLEFVTNQYVGATGIVMKYYVSDKLLYKLRRKFYELW